ncbi:uncharacterized protein LOC126657231 [Mercurialis annua]|uniref:uncharacterized protein LOC126657231 n=1 Tax=Mercurialis annua TaxID=3986 RepID=UPI00215ED899|nr:uncharacterized protein LOC126657231 [Mercurialis annua]
MQAKNKQVQKNQSASIHNLETHYSKLAIALQTITQGGLAATTEANPKEQVKSIELRNAPDVVNPPPPPSYIPKVTLGSFEGDASLCKILEGHYQYQRSWDENGAITMTESCSSIITKLPTKLKDPWSFTIPFSIGDMPLTNYLCDLGANINLMHSILFESSFGDLQVKTTPMMLQLADHSIKKPYGIIEDVLVKANKFIFPVYFVVLDYEIDRECPVILGRPFMNAWRALIDVHEGKLSLRIFHDKVDFDMKKA